MTSIGCWWSNSIGHLRTMSAGWPRRLFTPSWTNAPPADSKPPDRLRADAPPSQCGRRGGIPLSRPAMLYYDIAGRRIRYGEGPTMAHDDDDLKADIAERRPALVALRRRLHMHPELAHQEQLTAALVAEHLRRAGLAVTEGVGGTGVVGLLAGTAGGEGARRTLLVRADMDALPITEANEVEYASRAAGK